MFAFPMKILNLKYNSKYIIWNSVNIKSLKSEHLNKSFIYDSFLHLPSLPIPNDSYSGMLPCFLAIGFRALLVSIRSAAAMRFLVSSGSITSSMYPRAAAR